MTKAVTIDLDSIVDTAIDLIEQDGLENLSMRRLADRFGIQAASLYWHVRSKEQLLDLIADRLIDWAAQYVEQRPLARGALPAQRLKHAGMIYRSFLLNHPHSEQILIGRWPAGPSLASLVEPLGAMLTDTGVGTRNAATAVCTVLSFVQASVVGEKALLVVPSAENRAEVTLHVFENELKSLDAKRYPFTVAAAFCLTPYDAVAFSCALDAMIAVLVIP